MPKALITPMPDEIGPGPVLMVGGTFDPPHRGHTELAAAARAAVAPAAGLLFVPAARSPHKGAGPQASGADRARMLRLATVGIERAGVWTDELDRAEAGEPSYWVVTLRRARALLGDGRRLLFLIGADQALGFERWFEPEEVLGLAEAVVINRGAIATRDELARAMAGSRFADRLVGAWCEVPRMDISATGVRSALSGGNASDLRGVLHPEVASFIAERGLYAGSLDE